jgi:hypothetical protein
MLKIQFLVQPCDPGPSNVSVFVCLFLSNTTGGGYGGYSDASYGYGGRGGGYYAGEYIGTNGGGVQGWETLLNRNRGPYRTSSGNFVF